MSLLTASKFAHRALHSPLFWLAGGMLVATIATNLGADDSQGDPSKSSVKADEGALLREGTRFESRLAECRSEGDQLVLRFSDMTRAVSALENLASQRILKAVVDDPSDNQWVVTGTITEFQGRNYLFVDRVTRASRR